MLINSVIRIPTVKKILNKPILEVMTEYPVENAFFSGSKVLRIQRVPVNKEREIKNIVIEKLVRIKTNITIAIWEIITTLKLTSLKKCKYARKPKLIINRNASTIQRTLIQIYLKLFINADNKSASFNLLKKTTKTSFCTAMILENVSDE